MAANDNALFEVEFCQKCNGNINVLVGLWCRGRGPRLIHPSFESFVFQNSASFWREFWEWQKTSHPRQKFLTSSGNTGGGFSTFSGISGGGLLIFKNLVVVILRTPCQKLPFLISWQCAHWEIYQYPPLSKINKYPTKPDYFLHIAP